MQCCDVVLEKEGRVWNRKNTAVLKAMHLFDFQDGVMGDTWNGSEPKEVIYKDDSSEDSQGEDDVLEGWVPRLSE